MRAVLRELKQETDEAATRAFIPGVGSLDEYTRAQEQTIAAKRRTIAGWERLEPMTDPDFLLYLRECGASWIGIGGVIIPAG
jgi:hypothetical protein